MALGQYCLKVPPTAEWPLWGEGEGVCVGGPKQRLDVKSAQHPFPIAEAPVRAKPAEEGRGDLLPR